MKTVTLEMPDDIYTALARSADADRKPLSLWLLARLHGGMPDETISLSPEQRSAAWARMDQHSGAQSLGYPTGSDNESIDADLAREYGSRHEDSA